MIEPVTGEVLGPRLEGMMDLIEQDHVLVEFKTSARTMDSRGLHDSLQLTCYSYAYEMLYRRPPSLLKLVDFVKTKRPKIVSLQTEAKKLDYQRFFYLANSILKGIKSNIFFPRKSFMCKDCEYAVPCKGWTGNGN